MERIASVLQLRKLFVLVLICCLDTAYAIKITQIHCELQKNPIGIVTSQPMLGWQLVSDKNDVSQSAYEIEVLDVWNSGKQLSDESVNVPYKGPALQSFTHYKWRVRVWDKNGKASGWSKIATFVTGLLNKAEWKASWVEVENAGFIEPKMKKNEDIPTYWVRRDFVLNAEPGNSVVTIVSANYFELYINGQKASDDVLTPAVTDAQKQLYAITYDVSKLLRKGNNSIALWMGIGWADDFAFSAQINTQSGFILCADDWVYKPSPISKIGRRQWNNFGGERMDARAWQADWNLSGTNTQSWSKVKMGIMPNVSVNSQICPTNIAKTTLKPQSVSELGEGRYLVDFSKNLTGWLQADFSGLENGQKLKFYYADRIFTDSIQPSPIGNVKVYPWSSVSLPRKDGKRDLYQCFSQVSEYIASGSAKETFCNKFNYAGFRYVIIEGLKKQLDIASLKAILVESNLGTAGSFECSDELINRIHTVNAWTQRCLNLGGYYVDCPHRERMGYGDGQVALTGMMMNFNASGFYEKWVTDWRQTQKSESGKMPNTAPWGIGGGGAPWPGLIAAIPWQHYLHYGNKRILKDNFEAALAYTRYLDSRSTNDVLLAWGKGFDFIGDWVPPFRGMDTNNWPSLKAAELFCNCYRVYLWQQIANMAQALNDTEKLNLANERMESIRKAVHKAYFDGNEKLYVIDEQIYYIMPLLTGVAPAELRPMLIDKLRTNILVKNKGHLDTGMLGTLFMMQYLNQEGLDDLILTMYQQKTHPGWGYMVENGATTFWEQWNGYWSQIHSCFTSADNWLYQGLAGIQPDAKAPGFKNVIIKPAMVGDIKWVNACHQSPYGKIVCNWKKEGNKAVLNVEIPVNTSAKIYIPGKKPAVKTVGSGKHIFNFEM